jgi:hypothetical protein
MKYGDRRSAHIEKLCTAAPSQNTNSETEKTDKDTGATER